MHSPDACRSLPVPATPANYLSSHQETKMETCVRHLHHSLLAASLVMQRKSVSCNFIPQRWSCLSHADNILLHHGRRATSSIIII